MLTAKENSLLKDLSSQEKLCIEKYGKYAQEACDPQLKNLFHTLEQQEQQHLQTLNQISSGMIPASGQQGQQQSGNQSMQQGQQGQQQQSGGQFMQQGQCGQMSTAQAQQHDAFLCSDALSMEKYVSGAYDTSIFEFSSTVLRDTLNHIQKEEQQHGEMLYNYLSQHGMYS